MGSRTPVLVIVAWAVTLLMLASCGGAADEEVAPSDPVGESEVSAAPETTASSVAVQPAETTHAPSEEMESVTTTSRSTSGAPPAPDFTLELGGGGTFVLSEQTTPVLIVFWAEW